MILDESLETGFLEMEPPPPLFGLITSLKEVRLQNSVQFSLTLNHLVPVPLFIVFFLLKKYLFLSFSVSS